ncbi:MAG: cell envelope integrity protein CreD [Proteobacteria bacterium]|nr:cell envelope integrity protein CreD [Pseudomonadota bacterium]
MSAVVIPAPAPTSDQTGFFRLAFNYLTGNSLVARALLLAAVTLLLQVPLNLVNGIVADRQAHQAVAINSVTASWGGPQTFVGPTIIVPYAVANQIRSFALLPEKLTIDAKVTPEQRRRGLLAVTVFTANLDVVAQFDIAALRNLPSDDRRIDWAAASATLGLTDIKSINVATADIDGEKIDWKGGATTALTGLYASLKSADIKNRDTIVVRFHVSFTGSGSFSMIPLGKRTEATVNSSWPSPSFIGRYLPVTQSIDKDGFRASWSTSYLGRGYGQLWDGTVENDPMERTVLDSAFGVTLLNPVDAYRETDRAIKYGIVIIGLTFTISLLLELATGTRLSAAQYSLIGLSLCIFYLLLLSFAERIGFGPAYVGSASAVVAQAAIYNWALQRRLGPAIVFAVVLATLYAVLYVLLELEDMALLSGSLLLFTILSMAMWFTRNLHRTSIA